MMNLKKEAKTLTNYTNLPLKFRYFQRLIELLLVKTSKNPISILIKSMMNHKKAYDLIRRDSFINIFLYDSII